MSALTARRPSQRAEHAPAGRPERGRPLRLVSDATARKAEMLALRQQGKSLAEIGARFGVSRQRVEQILNGAGSAEAREAARARRAAEALRARERAGELLALWREGLSVGEIHQRTSVSYQAIRQIVKERATQADRDARAGKRRWVSPLAAFSERELLRGLRAVAGELRRSPSLREYDEFAPGLQLACGQTVYMRFGGWNKALVAAGLEPSPATRLYAPRWHIAACLRALESVADQLGDPPRYRRYHELARQRDDLPSGATLRARLGCWPSIAAVVVEQRARNGHRPAEPPATNGHRSAERIAPASANGHRGAKPPVDSGAQDASLDRLPSQLAARTLAYLAEHPGSSGRAVMRGVEIRHDSQAWALLARLAREGLLVKERNGSSSAWTLTERGQEELRELPEGAYA